MNTRNLGILCLVLALLPSPALAQMGIVKGNVVDQDGKPLADVAVRFDFLGELTRKFETTTNDKGRFTQVVNSGRYRITASADGYQSAYIDERIPSGPATEIGDLRLVNRAVAQERALAPILEKFAEAGRLSQAGKLDEALAVYEELKTDNDEVPELHFNMGALHARQQDWAAAEASFRRTLELKPDQMNAALALSGVLEQVGRTEEADALLAELATRYPDNTEVLMGLAVGLINAQRVLEAKPSLLKVVELEPDRAEARYYLAIVALNEGDIPKAVEHLEKYVELAPEDAQYRKPAEDMLGKLKASQQ